jgi:hypothetical protein
MILPRCELFVVFRKHFRKKIFILRASLFQVAPELERLLWNFARTFLRTTADLRKLRGVPVCRKGDNGDHLSTARIARLPLFRSAFPESAMKSKAQCSRRRNGLCILRQLCFRSAFLST